MIGCQSISTWLSFESGFNPQTGLKQFKVCCHLPCSETSTCCGLTAAQRWLLTPMMLRCPGNWRHPRTTKIIHVQWWDFILCCSCGLSAIFTLKPTVLFHSSLCLNQNAWGKLFLLLASQPPASSESAFICLCTHTLMLSWQHFLWPYCLWVRFKSSWRASPTPERSSCSVSHLLGVPVSVRADPAVAGGSSLPILSSLLLLRLSREPRPQLCFA